MKRISLYFLLIVAVLSSCQQQNINMHTIIHSDGTCERMVNYCNVMTQEERDSLLGEHLNGWSQPMPECLRIDAFCKSYTEVGKDDTVKTTFSSPFSSVEEMSQKTPLQMNGVRLKSSAKLYKRFRWFFTEYTFTETFASVGDSFKLPPINYADENIVSYWFTGYPNIVEGLSGAETMSKLNEIEPLINKWLNDNFVNLCFDYIVSHYDSIPNPPVSRQRFIEHKDSLVEFATKGKNDVLEIQPKTVFKDFFGSDSYAVFFDEDSNYGKELGKAFNDRLNIFGFNVPYTLSMPGTVTDAGTGICKDGVIYYPLTGERLIPQDYVISAKSRVTNIWAYIVTLLIILIAIGSWTYSKKPKSKND